MFKNFFDAIKLHQQIKVLKESVKTAKVNAEVCLELMEHPIKSQKQIKNLLKEIFDIKEV